MPDDKIDVKKVDREYALQLALAQKAALEQAKQENVQDAVKQGKGVQKTVGTGKALADPVVDLAKFLHGKVHPKYIKPILAAAPVVQSVGKGLAHPAASAALAVDEAARATGAYGHAANLAFDIEDRLKNAQAEKEAEERAAMKTPSSIKEQWEPLGDSHMIEINTGVVVRK